MYLIDHSCVPNAIRTFNGNEITVTTIEKVENLSDIKISYRPKLYETTKARRQDLMKSYFFTCHCPKCQDVQADHLKSSMRCSKCKGCVPIG